MSKKYINHFFSLRAASDLIGFFVGCQGRAGKEVTESMAMFDAATKRLELDPTDPNIVCIVVGDGAMPRTAGIVCHRSRWMVYSVDPKFNLENIKNLYGERALSRRPIRNLKIRRRKAEELKIDCKGKKCVLLLPHSHAPLKETIEVPFNYSSLDMVYLPCCFSVPEKYQKNAQVYYDTDIWSPKNQMHLWKNIK